MISLSDLINIYLKFWIITIPISCYLLYILTIELLDIILNFSKIKTLLKKSEYLNINHLFYEYEIQKEKQQALEKSTLLEMERQIKYSHARWTSEDVKRAKELSDTLKIK